MWRAVTQETKWRAQELSWARKTKQSQKRFPLYPYLSLDIWVSFPLRLSKPQISQLTACRQDCLCGRKGQGYCCLTSDFAGPEDKEIRELENFCARKIHAWNLLDRFPHTISYLSPTFQIHLSNLSLLFSLKLMCLSFWSPDYISPNCFNISRSYYGISSLSLI